MLSDPEGEVAVRWARACLATGVDPGRPLPPAPSGPPFEERRGVFVTLRRSPSGELRGCIGLPMPVMPLGRAIREAAVAAGTEDPRFRPVRASELDHLTVEVSALTVPHPIDGTDAAARLAAVQVGVHGLIVDGRGTSGLLLPQVAPEQGWGPEEFLDGTCEKAGLPADAWRDPRVRVRTFEAEIFAETAPGGAIARERPIRPSAGPAGR